MKEVTIEWHDASKELPKYDGCYLVSVFRSWVNYGDYSDDERVEVRQYVSDQMLWMPVDPLVDMPINALIELGDSNIQVMSWAKLPDPYDPPK